MRLTIFLSLLFIAHTADAQKYRFHLYRVEDGLPTDVIKEVTQDSLGFLWIATDDGLVKYDGLRFTTYLRAMVSKYVKGFTRTPSGRVIAFSDLDLIEVNNQVDTVLFRTLVSGSRTLTDTTVTFPKSIYQDASGNIWMGEQRTIVRYDGEVLTRFDLGEENRSTVFVRSFSFFEDNESELFAVSYQGNVFSFSQSDFGPPQWIAKLPGDVSKVLYHNKRIYIAAREGLYTAAVNNGKIEDISRLMPASLVSNLLIHDDILYVATYNGALYKLNLLHPERVELFDYDFRSISSCYISGEEDLWVATDRGLVLVQENLFQPVETASQGHFVEGIAEDLKGGRVFFCDKEKITSITNTKGNWSDREVYRDQQAYFQCLQHGVEGLWAASENRVLLFKDQKLFRTWAFSMQAQFIHDIYLDTKQNLWVSQDNTPQVRSIDKNLRTTSYSLPVKDTYAILVREGAKGIFVATNNMKSYLFHLPQGDTTFLDISIPLPFTPRGDFYIVDMAVGKDEYWLATTDGLLRVGSERVERVDLGEHHGASAISSVELLDESHILFSDAHGLYRYNIYTGENWLYDENAGLPSNTITAHGILVSPSGGIWIATSFGLAYGDRSVFDDKRTPTPYCVKAQVDGENQLYMKGITADYGAFISLEFTPITFPENRIQFQWRVKEIDSTWRTLEGRELHLSDLPPGGHHLEVKAKKNTGLGWSLPSSLFIRVRQPFWSRFDFILFIMLLIVGIAWASFIVSSRLARRRRAHLQQLVFQRTIQLQKANDELSQRNLELDRFVYSASHDLSAPLKSILGLISVARMEKPGETHQQYLQLMERSVKKLEEFINEVISYSRNTRMPLVYEPIDFRSFVQGILEDHQYSPNYFKIRFVVDDFVGKEFRTDTTRLKIILNNLISNAIKFHWTSEGRIPFVRITLDQEAGSYLITVEDNGRGIERKHLDRIFDMFFRGTEDTPGSGLGLYILKESVNKLGGKVWAESVPGEGATFKVRIPINYLHN